MIARTVALVLALVLALGFALPAWAQTYPSPTYQSVTILADPTAATQAARKGYVDTGLSLRILTSTLGQANGPAQLGSTGLLPVAQLPVGTATGTIAAGDDSRILGAQSASQVASAISTGIAANVSGTVAVANGGTGAITVAAARTNLGLGGAAILSVGTATGTVAAGDDSRIVGALQSSITALTALVITLPTTLPASAGKLWINGGTLSVS